MQVKEEKICSFTQNETRLQLTKVTLLHANSLYIEQFKEGKIKPHETVYDIIYQIRLNRKIIEKSRWEYTARKAFATYCQNIVLQLKIY